MDKTLQSRVQGLLGLSVRARQGTFGEDGCLAAIRNGNCALLVLDEGASEATRKRYTDSCGHYGVPLRYLPEGLLSQSTGRPGVAMALSAGGLSQQLLSLLPEENATEGSEENISGGVCAE